MPTRIQEVVLKIDSLLNLRDCLTALGFTEGQEYIFKPDNTGFDAGQARPTMLILSLNRKNAVHQRQFIFNEIPNEAWQTREAWTTLLLSALNNVQLPVETPTAIDFINAYVNGFSPFSYITLTIEITDTQSFATLHAKLTQAQANRLVSHGIFTLSELPANPNQILVNIGGIRLNIIKQAAP